MSIESVASELRPLRNRIHAQRANQHTWPTKEEELEADCDRYDRRLLKAATMLGVEAPSGLGREQELLTDVQRQHLERGLAQAGLDVQAPGAEATPTT